MPQLDLFIFFSTAFFIFGYAMIFWSITNNFIKAIFYFLLSFYYNCFQLFINITKFSYFYNWIIFFINFILVNRVYSYQSIINIHLNQSLII